MTVSVIKDIFTHKKIINNRFLNFFGLQLFRILMARVIYNLKSNNKEMIFDQGYQIYKDFFDKSYFSKLRKEYKMAFDIFEKAENEDKIFGTISSNVQFEKILEKKSKFPTLINFFYNKKVRNLIAHHENVDVNKLDEKGSFKLRLEKCSSKKSNFIKKAGTSNSNPHKDTFHRVTKIIFYMTDVDKGSGPLKFFLESHKLNLKILIREWIFSFTKMNGAPRYDHKFLQEIGFKEKSLTSKSNSLILADTGYGIHARGLLKESKKREVIWLEYRKSKPFFLN